MLLLKLLRIALVLIYFPLAAIVVIAVSLVRPFNPDNTRIGGMIFSWGARKIMGIKYYVEGRENAADVGPSIVVANHQDNMDLFVCGPVVPPRTVSVGKSSLKYLPFFGQAYWLAGNIMINRGNSKQSIDTLAQITNAIHEDQKSVWVFAEGTRNRGEGLLPFKKGAFHMALSAKVPIIPICVSTYPTHIDLGKWRSGSIIVKILPPIDTGAYDESNIQMLMDQVRELMLTTIADLDQRVEALDA